MKPSWRARTSLDALKLNPGSRCFLAIARSQPPVSSGSSAGPRTAVHKHTESESDNMMRTGCGSHVQLDSRHAERALRACSECPKRVGVPPFQILMPFAQSRSGSARVQRRTSGGSTLRACQGAYRSSGYLLSSGRWWSRSPSQARLGWLSGSSPFAHDFASDSPDGPRACTGFPYMWRSELGPLSVPSTVELQGKSYT